jgi:hypothetical protein
MQKLVILIALLALLLTAGCSVESIEGIEEEIHSDCPHGEVNCEYPGNCGKYIDTDNNDICDHSE